MHSLKIYLWKMWISIRASARKPFDAGAIFLSIVVRESIPVLVVWVLISKIGVMGGMSGRSVLLMLFIRTCAIGLKDSLCSGVRNLANAIWNGTIDQHLTQPGNVLSKNLVDENVQVLPVILAWGVVTGTLWTLLRPHAPAWLIVTFGVSGGLILFSMELILMSLTFWNIHPGQLHWMLFFVEEQYAQYPLTIFHPVIQAALTFLIPIGFVAFYPVASLYPVQVPMGISPPAWVPYLVAVVLLTLALVIWKAGLDRYTSTGT